VERLKSTRAIAEEVTRLGYPMTVLDSEGGTTYSPVGNSFK
jgi:hypothetical protein